MRVVVAPDKFAGTLTAVEAAGAIAEGWARRAPDDELVVVPMSDGGPGFLDVLHATLGGEVVACTTTDPYGRDVPGAVLLHEEQTPSGTRVTAYVESAQALGLHLTPDTERDAERAGSAGLATLLLTARARGADRVVVGLGGSAVNDGGAGLLQGLGAVAYDASGAVVDVAGGPRSLPSVHRLDASAAVEAVAGLELVVASDVDNPLLGLFGATKTYGPQKGLAEDRLPWVEGRLVDLVDAVDRGAGPEAADKPGTLSSRREGAGAAGGTGFALLLLGATRTPGLDVVADAVDLTGALRGADLVVTGEGAFDFSSRSGKVPYGVARAAEAVLAPCIALAGQVLVGSRETRALGIDAAYALVDLVGEERAFDDPRAALADLAERTARTWSRRR
ncbi:glycerate kinase [Nocardioidaceae bacterium]|nr:glycerate kinase [Nocardioidaceae bacterium]